MSEEGHGCPANHDSAWRAVLLRRSQAPERTVFLRSLYAESKWDSASPSGRSTASAASRYQPVDPASMLEILEVGCSSSPDRVTLASL